MITFLYKAWAKQPEQTKQTAKTKPKPKTKTILKRDE